MQKTQEKIFEVDKRNNVLTIKVKYEKPSQGPVMNIMESSLIMAIEDQGNQSVGAHEGTLMEFHQRLGHLGYDSIERIAKDPASGIKITDYTRRNCVTCAVGKQTRVEQSKKDSGANAPTDRIGGVICSDLKGPMTPRDRLGNRYMVNFVDYKTNYCRIFLAKTKDQAAKYFQHFITWFEREFNCKVRVLRTDGGGEYRTVDLFCSSTGIARKKTEANSSASNGKAERIHRTVMNMARSMIFASQLQLIFWGDAAQYASYVLNRSPSRSNPANKSPMEMLTGKVPDIRNIVVFGSKCMVYQDPKHKAKRAVHGTIIGSQRVQGLVDERKGGQSNQAREGYRDPFRRIQRTG